MGSLGKILAVAITLALSLLIPQRGMPAQASGPSAQAGVTGRYIQAIQNRDFKTVINLTSYYHQKIESIKAQNPRVLWPKLLGEFYQQTIPDFRQTTGGPLQSLGATVMAAMGDPSGNIRAALQLLPPSCKWSVTETRRGQQTDTVYVTVSYPDVMGAPIMGSQLLGKTILRVTLNHQTRLVDTVQKVSQADTYWSGGPSVRVAMATRFYRSGAWDQAISQLEPLESQNQLPANGKTILGFAYYQHVLHGCFATKVNTNASGYPKYPEFSGSQQCRADMKHAVTLQPKLEKEWAKVFLSYAQTSLNAGVFDQAASDLKAAAGYLAADPEQEAFAEKLRLNVAKSYLHLAIYNYAHQGNGDTGYVRGEIKSAADLVPGMLSQESGGVAVVKDCLQEAANEKARFHDGFADNYFFGSLEFMEKYGIPLRSQDVAEFLQWADKTKDPSKWRNKVNGLAAGGHAQTAETQPSQTPSGQTATSASPAEVSEALEKACNDRQFSEAETYFSSKLKAAINSPAEMAKGGIRAICNQQTRNGTIQRDEILKVEKGSTQARVDYRLHFRDGSTRDDHDMLVKENGTWKVNH